MSNKIPKSQKLVQRKIYECTCAKTCKDKTCQHIQPHTKKYSCTHDACDNPKAKCILNANAKYKVNGRISKKSSRGIKTNTFPGVESLSSTYLWEV